MELILVIWFILSVACLLHIIRNKSYETLVSKNLILVFYVSAIMPLYTIVLLLNAISEIATGIFEKIFKSIESKIK